MIISASRRTDIPAYYCDWFINRLHTGYVLVRNPMNHHQVSRISLAPDTLDGVVFWTKNPIPMLAHLNSLSSIPYYFQFTLTSYGQDIEPGIPSKNDTLIPAFISLSEKIGPDRIVWRYDPILLSEKYTIDYHIRYFEKMARRLSGYVNTCTISFLDIYRNTEKNMRSINPRPISEDDMHVIASAFSSIAASYDIALNTCAEKIDLAQYGIGHAKCIDPAIFELITGKQYLYSKDLNQRSECGCAPSIDIGAYNCCMNGCLYCYANYNKALIPSNTAGHDPDSPMLIGNIMSEDRITHRRIVSSLAGSSLPDDVQKAALI